MDKRATECYDERTSVRFFFTDEDYEQHLRSLHWTKEETLKLTEYVNMFGFDWDEVAQSFSDPKKHPLVSEFTGVFLCLAIFILLSYFVFDLTGMSREVPKAD